MIGGNIAEVVGEYVGMLVGIISFLISKQSIEWRPPLNPKTPKIRNHPTEKKGNLKLPAALNPQTLSA